MPVKRAGFAVAPAPAGAEHKRHRGQVRAGVGQQKAGGAQAQPTQKDQIVDQQRQRRQYAVHRHQAVEHPRADKLRAQRAQAAGQHAQVQPGQVPGRVGDQPHQRHRRQQQRKAGQNRGRAVDKDAGLFHRFVQPKADDRIRHAQADHRDQQVGGLLHQAGHAHHVGGIQRVAQIGADEKAQQLAAEVGDRKQQRVAGQRRVFFLGRSQGAGPPFYRSRALRRR